MEPLVVDSNIIVASFLQSEAGYNDARQYINGLEIGDYVFHSPMLLVVEVMSAISRRAQRNRLALLAVWKQNIVDWETNNQLFLYPLDRDRMNQAAEISAQYSLRGADSVMAALAEELDMPLRTFDREILGRFPRATS